MKINMVKRSSEEKYSGRFAKEKFQTTNLIVNHFKRDKDLEQIINLTGENNTLRRLLIASSVIHLYHYLGVKTINSLDIEVTAETSEKIELIEKKELFKEIEELASDSIEFELNLLLKALDYDEKIVSVMKERNEYDERFFNKLNNDFEEK